MEFFKLKKDPTKHNVCGKQKETADNGVNKFMMAMLDVFALGGGLLMTLDYLLHAQIPERSPVVIGFYSLLAVFCLLYWLGAWLKTVRRSAVRAASGACLTAAVCSVLMCGYSLTMNTINLERYFRGERIAVADTEKTVDELIRVVDEWRHTPSYSLRYISGDAYYATLYNSKGECMTQLFYPGKSAYVYDGTVVTLTDGTAVTVTADEIGKVRDTDALGYTKHALEYVKKGKARIERASPDDYFIPKDEAPEDVFEGTEYAVLLK